MKTHKLRHLKPRMFSVIVLVPLMLLAGGTFSISKLAGSLAQQKTAEQYQWDTQQISDRIQSTINGYSSVMYSGRAFILDSNLVEPREWTGFYRNQDIFNRFKGMNSIAYVELVSSSQKAGFLARMRANYGADYDINPASDHDTYALASLVVSDTISKPTGFDAYSTTDRKLVYQAAIDNGTPTASGQFKLNDSGAQGMFLALPVNKDSSTAGFVVVGLHSTDFFAAAIDPSKLASFAIKVTDVTDPANTVNLYTTGAWQDGNKALGRRDTINFGGRLWNIDYQAPAHYNQTLLSAALPRLILVLGLLMVCILALCFNIFMSAIPHYHPPLAQPPTKEPGRTEPPPQL